MRLTLNVTPYARLHIFWRLRWPVPVNKEADVSCVLPAEKQKLKYCPQDLGGSSWHLPVPKKSVCAVGEEGGGAVSTQLPGAVEASEWHTWESQAYWPHRVLLF